ncbi:MAG: hypothetical protein KatS3mg007_1026 [Thermoanaerobaculum sp.]|jgi:uncharacterized tellurite resistance protein B-like protein|nr:MAG: hypothetical protein KatS3mg007_1026 [Thermoanaerobaculum sp.]
MGLFDGFKQRAMGSLNEQQAIMTIVVAAVKADESVSPEEIQRIKAMCVLSPIFASNSADQDIANIRFADTMIEQFGEEAIVRAAEALTPELRETAFAFACDMVLADGVLGPSEERFMTGLAQKLGLRDDSAQAIVYATIVRNRALS